MEVGVIVHKDLSHKDLVAAQDKSVVPVLRQGVELVHVVFWQIRVIKRRSFDTAIRTLELRAAFGVNKPPIKPIVTIRVKGEQSFTGGVQLTETTMKLEKDILLHLLSLIDPEEAQVVVLELLWVIEWNAVNARAVD